MILSYLQQVQDSVTGIRCRYVTTTPVNPPSPTQTQPNLTGPGTIVPGSYAIIRTYTDDVPPSPDVVYSDANPQPLGAVNPGDVNAASRANHVHPMPSAADVGAPTVAALEAVSDVADAASADAAQASADAAQASLDAAAALALAGGPVPITCGTGDVVGACVRITGPKSGIHYPVETVDLAAPADGIAVGIITTKTSSTEGTMVLRGSITGVYVGLEPGKTYVIGASGQITRTPPTPMVGQRAFVQTMGWALDTTEFFAAPSSAVTILQG